MLLIMIHGWVEDLHTDRTSICFIAREAEGECWDPVKLA